MATKKTKSVNFSLIVDEEILNRAEKLIDPIKKKSTELFIFGRLTKSSVLKLAIVRGLESLENEFTRRRKTK